MSGATDQALRVVHCPALCYQWQVQVKRRDGQWRFLDARKTENAAMMTLNRIAGRLARLQTAPWKVQ